MQSFNWNQDDLKRFHVHLAQNDCKITASFLCRPFSRWYPVSIHYAVSFLIRRAWNKRSEGKNRTSGNSSGFSPSSAVCCSSPAVILRSCVAFSPRRARMLSRVGRVIVPLAPKTCVENQTKFRGIFTRGLLAALGRVAAAFAKDWKCTARRGSCFFFN